MKLYELDLQTRLYAYNVGYGICNWVVVADSLEEAVELFLNYRDKKWSEMNHHYTDDPDDWIPCWEIDDENIRTYETGEVVEYVYQE